MAALLAAVCSNSATVKLLRALCTASTAQLSLQPKATKESSFKRVVRQTNASKRATNVEKTVIGKDMVNKDKKKTGTQQCLSESEDGVCKKNDKDRLDLIHKTPIQSLVDDLASERSTMSVESVTEKDEDRIAELNLEAETSEIDKKRHYRYLHLHRGLLNSGGEEEGKDDMSQMQTATASCSVKPPEVDKMVAHVRDTVQVNLKDLELFSVCPSPLGVSQSDIDNMMDKLCAAGFNKRESRIILPHFPTTLETDLSKLRKVCQLLEQYQIQWKNLLSNGRHVFLYTSSSELKKNLMTLRLKLKLMPATVERMLVKQPLLFYCPISDHTTNTVVRARNAGFGKNSLQRFLVQALTCWPTKIHFSSDVAQTVGLLRQLKVNPDYVLTRYPSFFSMTSDTLMSLIELLSGTPLYLDTPTIQMAITTTPHLVAGMTDHEELKGHIHELCHVFGSVRNINIHLHRTPALLSPTCLINKKVEYLHSVGFTSEQISILVNRIPSILTQDLEQELKPRMRLFLEFKDTTPQSLLEDKSSSLILIRNVQRMRVRVRFALEHNERLLLEGGLQEVFGSSDEEFTQMCGKTMKEFNSAIYQSKSAGNETYDNHPLKTKNRVRSTLKQQELVKERERKENKHSETV